MEKSTITYIFDALKILRSNKILLLFPVILGTPLFIPEINISGRSYLLFFILPIIYGRFVEIIYEYNRVSLINIFLKHWLNFTLVKITLFLPFFLAYPFLKTSGNNISLPIHVMDLCIDVLSIYIIPLVIISQKRISSISLGIKCLLGNFQFTFPLVFLSLLSFVITFFLWPLLSFSFDHLSISIYYGLPQAMIGGVLVLFKTFIDFTVFISACFIIKTKLFCLNKNEEIV